MKSSSFLIPSSELTGKQKLGETYLDLMFATLKESSRIALFLWWPTAYGLEPSNSEAHWKRQNEILVKLLHEISYGGDSLDYEFGPLELVSECLTNELKFQATFEAEVRQFLEDYTPDDDIYEEVVELLEYLLTTQASLSRRLRGVTSELEVETSRWNEKNKDVEKKDGENKVVESVAA